MSKPPLTVVGPRGIGDQPPRQLGSHGIALWRTVLAEYQIDDVGGREMLAQACVGLDRAEGLAAEITADGEIIRSQAGPRAHPAIKEELAARSFVVRTLARLGLNSEPVRATVGRPPNRWRIG
jgi:hypothetical protein